MEEIKGIINQVIQKLQPAEDNEKQEILLAWQKILSTKERDHCCVVNLRDKILVVNVDSSTQLYQFTLEKQKLIKKLNKRLKKDIIGDIYFRIGKIEDKTR